MRPDTKIIVSLFWEQVEQICTVLVEAGRAELTRLFDDGIILAQMQEGHREAYTRTSKEQPEDKGAV